DDYFWNVLTPNGPPFGGPFYNTQSQATTIRQESEELKLVSPAEADFSWLVGAFYSDVNVDEVYVRTLPPAGLNVQVVPDTKTYDLYGRTTWKILPATSLVTGLRFNHDAISYKYNQYVTFPISPPAYYSTGSSSQNSVVGDISLKQQFTENAMGYISY